MEFITLSHPSQKSSATLQKAARSHAARVAHARAKKARKEVPEGPDQRPVKKVTPKPGSRHTTRLLRAVEYARVDTSARFSTGATAGPWVDVTTPLSIFGAFQHEPIASFVNSLSHQERFAFDHYIRTVTFELEGRCPTYCKGPKDKTEDSNWLPLTSLDIELLRGCILISSRQIALTYKNGSYEEMATKHKLRLVREVRGALFRENLAGSSQAGSNGAAVARSAVINALVLTLEEAVVGNSNLALVHLQGALDIVSAAGGVDALDLSHVVQHVLRSCETGLQLLMKESLASAGLAWD
ncbi:hypothetical protein CC79DRAFT_1338394 [Sarocladium strictum]